jgi:signal recognition particle receptor subunit beta
MRNTIYIKKLSFVDHVMVRRFINLDDIVNRNMVANLLMNGCEPIDKRFKTGNDIFEIYHKIPNHLIINKEDLQDVKTCPKTGYYTAFSNPVKFTKWPNPEIQQILQERRDEAHRIEREGKKPFEGVRVWARDKKREYRGGQENGDKTIQI